MDILKLIESREKKLETLQAQLEALKAEFKTAETPGVRQLIHEDIVATLDQIDATETAIAKLKLRVN